MPRVGGVYSPPAGTKGVPNTTIQSAPYNAFVDDLSSDANNPRPVTAGGTGATNTTAARASLGADNASNLTSGTVADARLPTSQAGKTFTTAVTIATDATGTTVIDQKSIELFWTAGPYIDFKNAAVDDWDARIQLTGGNTLTFTTTANMMNNGGVIWTSGNDGPGSGMDADVLDGQEGAFYQNSSNQNAGTLADARLPGSMANKTLTGATVISGTLGLISNSNTGFEIGRVDGVASTTVIDFHTGATFADYDTRIETTGGTGANAGGTMNFLAANLNHAGQKIWNAGNDGAGSGLDADFLDGQSSAYFGDIPARLGFTPVQQGGGGGQGTNKIYIGWLGSQLGLQIDASNQGATWPINISGTINGIASSSIAQISPSSITGETNFPIGHTITMLTGSATSRNQTATPCLFTGDTEAYVKSDGTSPGAALGGTWRCRGRFSASGQVLMERVS
jgi:hypothetical protein